MGVIATAGIDPERICRQGLTNEVTTKTSRCPCSTVTKSAGLRPSERQLERRADIER